MSSERVASCAILLTAAYVDVDLRDIARTSAAVHASPTNKDVTSITNAADVSVYHLFASSTTQGDNDMKADLDPQTGAKV